MVCIVIARNGEGDAWKFKTPRHARLCPIPQAYDVYACSAEELVRQYGRVSVGTLSRFVLEKEKSRVAEAIERWQRSSARYLLEIETRELIWRRLCDAAKTPPTDPSEVVRIVEQDRVALEDRVLRSIPDPAGPTPQQQDKGETDMSERKRINNEATITVLAEKNPKREGSKAYANFTKYVDGMTVAAAKEAGVPAADIAYDSEKGYIRLDEPEQAAA